MARVEEGTVGRDCRVFVWTIRVLKNEGAPSIL